jgi:hypothetical protein
MGNIMDTSVITNVAESGESSVAGAACLSLGDLMVLLLNFERAKNMSIPLDVLYSIFTSYVGFALHSRASRNEEIAGGNNANILYLSMPLTLSMHAVCAPNSLTVTVRAHDQGWSSNPRHLHGTRTSYTWGELALSTSPATRFEVHRNLHACNQFELQVRSFPATSSLMVSLLDQYNQQHQQGDCSGSAESLSILYFVRSMYPGWCNITDFVSIEVEWALTRKFLEHVQSTAQRLLS